MNLKEFQDWVDSNKRDGFVLVEHKELKNGRMKLLLETTHNSKSAFSFNSIHSMNKFIKNNEIKPGEVVRQFIDYHADTGMTFRTTVRTVK